MIVGIAAAVSAQQTLPSSQEEIKRIQQEYQDQLRRSTLIGPDDDPAIELPNGELSITLGGESITFDFTGSVQVERSYALVEQGNQRYSLEIRDDRSARTLVDFELAPCGLFIESEGVCDAFCENFADEVGVPTDEQIRDIARQMNGGRDDESLERIVAMIRESIEEGPQPLFPKRAYFIGAQ